MMEYEKYLDKIKNDKKEYVVFEYQGAGTIREFKLYSGTKKRIYELTGYMFGTQQSYILPKYEVLTLKQFKQWKKQDIKERYKLLK